MTMRSTPAARAASMIVAVPRTWTALVGLVADLAVDPGAVDDGFAASQRVGESLDTDIQSVSGAPRQDHRLMAARAQSIGEMPSDEAGPARDRDPHRGARTKTKPRAYGVSRTSSPRARPASAATRTQVSRDWK